MEVAAPQLLPMAPQDPNSPSSSTSSSSPSSAAAAAAASPCPHHPLPPSPRPVPRTIDTTPLPTTFVQADTASFKQVVQMLTGADLPLPPPTPAPSSSSQRPPASKTHHHHGGAPCGPKKPAFKLFERRSGMKNFKMIAPLAMASAAGASPRKALPDLLSPSVLDFPSLALSPVTPLVPDPFNRSASASPAEEQEAAAAERAAIARKGFFLHPSPRGEARPRLLPLFPVTSPRMDSAAAPSSEQI